MTHIQGLTTERMMNEQLQENVEKCLKGNLEKNLSGNLGGGLEEHLDAGLPKTLLDNHPTQTPATVATGITPRPLSMHIKNMLEDYFHELDGHPPANLYQMVLAEVEQPLLESVLHYTRGNQSKAATMLGLNRGTLRKKLKQYNIN